MSRPVSPVITVCGKEEYTAFLERKMSLIQQTITAGVRVVSELFPGRPHLGAEVKSFADSLRDLLTLEIAAELTELAKPQPEPPQFPVAQSWPTPAAMDWDGALVKAQDQVNLWQERVAALNRTIEEAPKELAAIWRVALLPMAEDALRSAESQRDYVQSMIEQRIP